MRYGSTGTTPATTHPPGMAMAKSAPELEAKNALSTTSLDNLPSFSWFDGFPPPPGRYEWNGSRWVFLGSILLLAACSHTAQETALTVKDVVEAVISEMWVW